MIAKQDQQYDPGAIRVLAVDDDNINLELLGEILFDLEITFDRACGGKEAMELLDEFDYAVIFMDLNMPDMNGFETTQLIRNRHDARKLTPIVGLSANDSSSQIKKCLIAGMQNLLEKPLREEEIIEVIQRYSPCRKHELKKAKTEAINLDIPQLRAIDLDDAYARFKGNIDNYLYFLSVFLTDNASCAKQMISLSGRNDVKSVEDMAHKLKGMASNLSLKKLSELAGSVESLAKNENRCPNMHQLDEIHSVFQEIVTDVKKIESNFIRKPQQVNIDDSEVLQILEGIYQNLDRDLIFVKHSIARLKGLSEPSYIKKYLDNINDHFMRLELEELRDEVKKLIRMVGESE